MRELPISARSTCIHSHEQWFFCTRSVAMHMLSIDFLFFLFHKGL